LTEREEIAGAGRKSRTGVKLIEQGYCAPGRRNAEGER